MTSNRYWCFFWSGPNVLKCVFYPALWRVCKRRLPVSLPSLLLIFRLVRLKKLRFGRNMFPLPDLCKRCAIAFVDLLNFGSAPRLHLISHWRISRNFSLQQAIITPLSLIAFCSQNRQLWFCLHITIIPALCTPFEYGQRFFASYLHAVAIGFPRATNLARSSAQCYLSFLCGCTWWIPFWKLSKRPLAKSYTSVSFPAAQPKSLLFELVAFVILVRLQLPPILNCFLLTRF